MALELYNKLRVRGKPLRALTALGHRMVQLGLEPLKQGPFQVREGEGYTGLIVGEHLGASSDVHRALEDEGVEFVRVGPVEGVGVSGLQGTGGGTTRADVSNALRQESKRAGEVRFVLIRVGVIRVMGVIWVFRRVARLIWVVWLGDLVVGRKIFLLWDRFRVFVY